MHSGCSFSDIDSPERQCSQESHTIYSILSRVDQSKISKLGDNSAPIRIKDTRILSDDYYLLKKTALEIQQRDGPSLSVMPALGAGIHEFGAILRKEVVDARVDPRIKSGDGHDGNGIDGSRWKSLSAFSPSSPAKAGDPRVAFFPLPTNSWMVRLRGP
jgi:hypothetical protein